MSENLKNGITAHKAGDKVTARRLFAQALKEDPNSERAWQWMFNAANNDTERIKCLREILRINPDNDKAQSSLDGLQGVSRTAPARLSAKTPHPWYRSTAIYTILFFLFFPALLILILTDEEERQWTKVVSWIIVGLFVANICIVGALTVLGPLIEDTFNDINNNITEGALPATATSAFLVQPSTPVNVSVTKAAAPDLSPTPSIGNINNPYPFDSDIDLVYTAMGGEKSYFRLRVAEIIRGESANDLVRQANMYNENPLPGTSWMLINLSVTLDDGTAIFLDGYDFSVISSGKIYSGFDTVSACCLRDLGLPEFETNIAIPGTTANGWITRLVNTSDTKPLLVINLDEYNTDLGQGIYFSLYE